MLDIYELIALSVEFIRKYKLNTNEFSVLLNEKNTQIKTLLHSPSVLCTGVGSMKWGSLYVMG